MSVRDVCSVSATTSSLTSQNLCFIFGVFWKTFSQAGHVSDVNTPETRAPFAGTCLHGPVWEYGWLLISVLDPFVNYDHILVFGLVDTWTSGPWGTNHSHRGRPVEAFPHSQSETRINSIFLIGGKLDQKMIRFINVGHVSFSWPTILSILSIVLLKCLWAQRNSL